MKTERSYRVNYSYIDLKEGKLNNFIDVLGNRQPSDPKIRAQISQKWKQKGYSNSHIESVTIDSIE